MKVDGTNGDSGNIGANDDPLETIMIQRPYKGGKYANGDNGFDGENSINDIGTNGLIGTSGVIGTTEWRWIVICTNGSPMFSMASLMPMTSLMKLAFIGDCGRQLPRNGANGAI